jgi:hypothetical protein
LLDSILQNDLVNDLTANDTSPPKKLFLKPIELLKDHMSTTSGTLHGTLLSIFDFMQHHFTGRAREVNRVNPVFLQKKSCIFRVFGEEKGRIKESGISPKNL